MSKNLNILLLSKQTLLASGLTSILSDKGGDVLVEQQYAAINVEAGNYNLSIIDLQPDTHIPQNIPRQLNSLVILQQLNQGHISEVLNSSAQGCITASCSVDEIKSAVEAVVKGERFYCKRVLDAIVQNRLTIEIGGAKPTGLSKREEEIATLVAKGLTNKAVAEKLFISIHTVQTHRKNIMKKLGLNSLSELVQYAINNSLISSK